MNNKYISFLSIAILIALVFTHTSCSDDFFETPDETTFNEDSIFIRYENTLGLMNKIYESNPRTLNRDWGDRLYGSSPDCLTDLGAGFLGQPALSVHKFHNAQLTTQEGSAVGTGTINGQFSGGEFIFRWGAIRYAHIILDRVDEVPDASQAQKDRLKGECYTLLAWHNLEMWSRFGGVPLVKKRLDDVNDQKIPRSTCLDTYNYILELCQAAIDMPNFPAKSTGTEFGRVNKAMAYALRARAKLFAASPLFNTATPYIDYGANNAYICMGNTDRNRWKEAVDAATDAINYCESNGYSIVDDASGRLDGTNYLTATTKTPTAGNTEIICGFQQEMGDAGKSFFMPRGSNFNGWAGTTATHNLVELYRNLDGSAVNWQTPITTAVNKPTEPYDNLEPRFQVSVGYNGCHWIKGNGAYDLQFWEAADGKSSGAESPVASKANYSYTTRKYTYGYEDIRSNNRQWWILHVNMRLAEMYMIRAEAQNEFNNGPDAQVRSDLNKILNRSGMSVPSSITGYNDMKLFIERENAIEFYLEDHRYLNLKRTLRAMDVLNFTAVDARCIKNANGTYTYTRTAVQERKFLKKYYLWPFPQKEIDKQYGLIQNPEW